MGVDVGLFYVVSVYSSFNCTRGWLTVSHVLIPDLYACSSSGKLSASFKTHGCHSVEPKLIAPRMTFETLRPDLPKLDFCQHRRCYHESKLRNRDERT